MRRAAQALGALLALGALASAGDTESRDAAKPAWHKGSTWTVKIHPIGMFVGADSRRVEITPVASKTVNVRFLVEALETEDKVSCYRVRVTREDRADDDLILIVREQDLSLKRLIHRHKPSRTETVVANERAPYVALETSSFGPLDWPLFPGGPIASGTETKTFELAGERSVKQTTTVDAEGTTTYVLETTVGKKQIVSTMKWAKDADFWSSAQRTVDGKDSESGELAGP
jgi:hypothetical protein